MSSLLFDALPEQRDPRAPLKKKGPKKIPGVEVKPIVQPGLVVRNWRMVLDRLPWMPAEITLTSMRNGGVGILVIIASFLFGLDGCDRWGREGVRPEKPVLRQVDPVQDRYIRKPRP